MGRPAKFTEATILEAASAIVAANGPGAATISAIAAAIGAPSGSIYHRFGSRDELLGRLWLRKAAFFQDAFADALEHPDAQQAAIEAALSLPRSARADFQGARIMLLHRREDFLSDAWPADMKEEAVRLGRQFDQLLTECTERLFSANTKASRLRTAFAVLDVPFAATRRHVAANRAPPPELDPLVAAAVAGILGAEPLSVAGHGNSTVRMRERPRVRRAERP
jgi:AcrR family transcriptional regulator